MLCMDIGLPSSVDGQLDSPALLRLISYPCMLWDHFCVTEIGHNVACCFQSSSQSDLEFSSCLLEFREAGILKCRLTAVEMSGGIMVMDTRTRLKLCP